MSSIIKRLTIEGYKSIRELRDFELRNLNVLIGANGAGKSNFISFFRMLSAMYESRFQLYVQKQGGPDALMHYSRKATARIVGALDFGLSGYDIELEATQDNRLIFAKEGVSEHGFPETRYGGTPESTYPALRQMVAQNLNEQEFELFDSINPPIEDLRVYHFHDTSDSARVKQVQQVNDTLRLKEDGANLAPYLRMLREKHEDYYRLIIDSIQLAAPFFGDFVYRGGSPSTVELEWTEKGDPDTPYKAHFLSDGTLRFICLCTLLQQPWNLMPSVILLDEPELGLHPYALAILAELLQRAAERKQVILATQSVELLNCLAPEDVVVVEREERASTFKRLNATQLENWLEDYSLGDLWKQNVFGGRP